ncbi:MAG: hypothetical protein CVV64_04855 [Candidatus Wallbacteria bacterium HGW-Wallbacteria-1]|jgi:transketolase|uniref:Transketolase-like pyrimidine-binding domain-containing protein n=1 Tax=Candidatus Wallbacteria bacterium HGW-Wallbacteria-1 TaxID=2013854 RepID=A0A2N1PRY9_9BACT|nr:MAG: hypothetical protein CVV64_04855 [Candidatus Wallbacteria bacterium HGW-Wallbacteria-1]
MIQNTQRSIFLVPQDRFDVLRKSSAGTGSDALKAMKTLCCFYRINALGAIMAAGHGWLGASFSCVEILATIYSNFIENPGRPVNERNRLILSKGHAAATHYAILAAHGLMPVEALLRYKDCRDSGGLPAHSDLSVNGVDAGSGSLGMGISKAIGFTMADRLQGRENFNFVILGDGELQEGQVMESLLSLASQDCRNCIIVIDVNGLQSDSPISCIKNIFDLEMLISSMGLVPCVVDGHEPESLMKAFERITGDSVPGVVLAQTVKGYGSTITAMGRDTAFGEGVWHGKVPDESEYREIIAELVKESGDPDLRELYEGFIDCSGTDGDLARLSVFLKGSAADSKADSGTEAITFSTEEAFGDALVQLIEKKSDDSRFSDFIVLDADLRKSCRLAEFQKRCPERFMEIGISEQDMVSIAEGISLGGAIPVINTYAAFLRRAYDQIWSLASQSIPAIIAGHYSGLDYFTDGRSHQSVNDISMMRSCGIDCILEPLTPLRTRGALEWAIGEITKAHESGQKMRPVYLRLHRTAVNFDFDVTSDPLEPISLVLDGSGTWLQSDDFTGRTAIFCSDPHMVKRAMKVCSSAQGKNSTLLFSIGVLPGIGNFGEVLDWLSNKFKQCRKILILDSDFGPAGLSSWLQETAAREELHASMEIVKARGACHSTRNLEQMLELQGFGMDELVRIFTDAATNGR